VSENVSAVPGVSEEVPPPGGGGEGPAICQKAPGRGKENYPSLNPTQSSQTALYSIDCEKTQRKEKEGELSMTAHRKNHCAAKAARGEAL